MIIVSAACALSTIIEPTGYILTSGQVFPVFVYLGFVLIALGQSKNSKNLIMAGLVCVSLKPQIGIFVLVSLSIVPSYRLSVLWSLIISFILAMPHFALFSPMITAEEYLANLGKHASIGASSVYTMTGPLTILARLGFVILGSIQFVLMGVVALVAGILLKRNSASRPALGFLVAGVGAFVPLHLYDLTFLILVPILLFDERRNWGAKLVMILPLALLIRPGRLERELGIMDYYQLSSGILIATCAALFLFLIAAVTVYQDLRGASRLASAVT